MALSAVAVTVLTACAGQAPPDASPTDLPAAAAGRTGTSGTSLTLDGRPWWPIGINAYQLGTRWDINAGCGAQVDLDDYFGRLPENSLTRVNVYSSMAVDKATGALDFRALDAVFDAAARHRQLLVAVLTGGEGACESGYFKDHDWYVRGWRTAVPDGVPMSYANWLDTAVRRWGASPALAGWTAVGEPEPSNCTSRECEWESRVCPPDAAAVLREFFDDAGARIRALDPDAVIWTGRAGGGQCGSMGDEYQMVGESPGVDVLEFHAYDDGLALPGDSFNGLQRRIDQARAVNKPLVVAELGITAGSCLSLPARAAQVSDLVAAQRARGTAGVLFWSFVPDPRNDQCTLDIGPRDPLFAMVGH